MIWLSPVRTGDPAQGGSQQKIEQTIVAGSYMHAQLPVYCEMDTQVCNKLTTHCVHDIRQSVHCFIVLLLGMSLLFSYEQG